MRVHRAMVPPKFALLSWPANQLRGRGKGERGYLPLDACFYGVFYVEAAELPLDTVARKVAATRM